MKNTTGKNGDIKIDRVMGDEFETACMIATLKRMEKMTPEELRLKYAKYIPPEASKLKLVK